MLIKSIELHNIRSHKNSKIIFPSSSTLLSGDIGSGKSSVLLALEFGLFGFKKGELEGKNLLRHGSSKGFVKIEIELDKPLIIYREIFKKGNSFQQGECFLKFDGKIERLGVEEINTKITKLLNFVDPKKKNLIFRYTVYTPQEEMKRILLESSDERLEIIRKLFNLDKYKRIEENLEIYLRDLRANIKVSEEEIRDLDAMLESIKEMEKEIEKLKREMGIFKNNLENLEAKRKEKEREISKLEKEISEDEEKIFRLNKIKAQIEEKEKVKRDLGEELKEVKVEKSFLEVKKEKEELLEKSSKIDGEIENIYNAIEKLRKEKEKMIKEFHFNNKKIEELEREIEESLNLDVCPRCKQKVSEEHKNKVIEKLKEQIDSFKKNNASYQEKIREAEIEIEKKEEEIKNLNRLAREIEGKIKEKDIELEKIKNYERKKERIKFIEEEIEKLKKEIFKLHIDEKEYLRKKEVLRNLKDEFKKIDEDFIAAKEEYIKRKESLNTISSLYEERKKEVERKKEIKEKIKRLKLFSEWLNNDFYNVIKDLEKIVMFKINKEFEYLLRKWFNMLVEDINVRLSEDFTPIIEQNGHETDYLNLSGGEKTALALAYRLALNQLINSLTNVKTKGLIILDEPTDGFSQNQLEKMRDIFKELNAKQLIIVSHDPKIESFVDNIIKFEKRDGISKVIQDSA
jgi:exonuclease SbcC